MTKNENDIDELLVRIKTKTGLTQDLIAKRIGYNRSYISQAKKTDSEKLYAALYKEFKNELEKLTFGADKSEGEFSKTAILDLTASTKKLSTSNEINAENIRRLITLLESQLGLKDTSRQYDDQHGATRDPALPLPGTKYTESGGNKKASPKTGR